MKFSVTYYSKLHVPLSFIISSIILYQVKMPVFYIVQTTNSTFVGKKRDIQKTIIALCNPK